MKEKRHKRDEFWVRQLTLADPEEPGLAGPTLKSNGSGELTLTNAAGTAVTLAAAELAYTDGLTAGTVTASKALVVDANKDLAELRNLGADRLDLGAAQGAAGSASFLVVRKTGIADNTATAVLTVTVPNGEHNAAIFLDILAHLGTGTDLSESSRCAAGCIVLARKTGDATVAVAATLTLAQIATTSGGATLTLAYGVTSITGAAGATQTFSITVTLVKTGTVDDHVVVVAARLLNSAAAGVTIAAAA